MIQSPVIAWTLTLLFIVTGGYCLLRCAHPGTGLRLADRLAAGADLLMSLGMLAMVWAWPLGPRRDLPLTLFAVAAGWFVVRAVGQRAHAGHPSGPGQLGAGQPSGHGRVDVGQPSGHGRVDAGHASGHGRLEYLHSAAAMGTMVWMVAVAPAALFASAGRSGHALMAGMSAPLAAAQPSAVNAVLGGYFAMVAVAWTGKTVRLVRASPVLSGGHLAPALIAGGPGLAGSRWAATAVRVVAPSPAMACHALMSAGMGILLLAMI